MGDVIVMMPVDESVYKLPCGAEFVGDEAVIDHYVRGCEVCEDAHEPECANHDHKKVKT